MDLSKIVNSKTFKVAAIIALPTVLVAGFYGYKYFKNKADERKKTQQLIDMQKKYSEIKTVDDFIEGSKYLNETSQYGYDFTKLNARKEAIEKIPFDKLKRLYELAKKGMARGDNENEEFLQLVHLIFP
jgi:hypothetical protein